MARPSPTRFTPTHLIFETALAEGVVATYAHTLAECLFWSQKAKHLIEGRPAIFKTGTELSGKLGLAPRTINGHFKKLANMGYWRIKYRARPHHPSPVTWLVISDRSMKLLTKASAHSSRKTRSSPTDRREVHQSNEQLCDVQTLEDDTTYRHTDIQDAREERSFIRRNEDRRNETSRYARRRISAPRYVEASEDLESLINAISHILDELALEPWDTVSRHTWEHSRELLGKLSAHGCDDLSDQIELVSQIIHRWSGLRFVMEDRYAHHSGNRERPTPMALNHQFKKIFAGVQEQSHGLDQSKSSHSSLDSNFG